MNRENSSGESRDNRSRSDTGIVLQEVFSQPGESGKPIGEQECRTLDLIDFTDSWRPGFAVQRARVFWSEIDRQFMFDEIETELCPLLIDAEERYKARRLDLVKTGFVQSDMEF